MMQFYFLCAILYSKDMIFNCISISLHKKDKFTLHFLFITISQI